MSNVNVYIPLGFNGIVRKSKCYEGFTFTQVMTYAGALVLCFDALSYLQEVFTTDFTVVSFLKNFWLDDLLFFAEASFLLAIKPFLSNSPTSWYKRFIFFDGEELIVNRLGVNSRSVNLYDVVSFEDRNKKSSKGYLTFTHRDGTKTRIPWLLGHEIKESEESTINELLLLIQERIDQNINQTFFFNPANVS